MTKLYLLLGVPILMTATSEAQFETGQRVLGGNLGFSTGKAENTNTITNSSSSTNVSVSPSIGWFKKPNLLHGIQLSYGYNSQKSKNSLNSNEQTIRNNIVGLSVFSERFMTISQKLFFTINTSASVSYSFGKEINNSGSVLNTAKKNGYGIGGGLAPGLSYRLTPRLLFDARLNNLISVGYLHNQTKYNPTPATEVKSTQDNFYLSSSLSNTNLGSVGLGFRLLLKK